MLVEKYRDDFLCKYPQQRPVVNIASTVEYQANKSILEWGNKEVEMFARACNTNSVPTLETRFGELRKLGEYIAKREQKTSPSFSVTLEQMLQWIDIDDLLSVTISPQQYTYIKNHLTVKYQAHEYNVRDKLIFELAWWGLTQAEIKILKEENIEFQHNDMLKHDIALLRLPKRIVRIEDAEVVFDIKRVQREVRYLVTDRNGIQKLVPFRDSDMLIKATEYGTKSNKKHLDNPSHAIQAAMYNNNVRCEGIDLERITVNDIRRSRLIWLLSRPEYDIVTVGALYGFKNYSGLTWLQYIAKKKYHITDDTQK